MAYTSKGQADADMMLLRFFFLLWPGEYAYSSSPDAATFCLKVTHILMLKQSLMHRPWTTLHQSCSSGIHYPKNGVRGEMVCLGRTAHPLWCPVRALINCICHLRTYNAPPSTPIYSHFDTTWRCIDTTTLTTHLCTSLTVLGACFGIWTDEIISIRSLHSSGAMALLCARVDRYDKTPGTMAQRRDSAVIVSMFNPSLYLHP